MNNIPPEIKTRLDQPVAWILDPESIDPHTIKAPRPTQACYEFHLDAKRFSNIISMRVFRQKNRALNKRIEFICYGGNNRILSKVVFKRKLSLNISQDCRNPEN